MGQMSDCIMFLFLPKPQSSHQPNVSPQEDGGSGRIFNEHQLYNSLCLWYFCIHCLIKQIIVGCGCLFTRKGSVWDSGKEKSISLSLIINQDRLPQWLLTAVDQPEEQLRMDRMEKSGNQGPQCHGQRLNHPGLQPELPPDFQLEKMINGCTV